MPLQVIYGKGMKTKRQMQLILEISITPNVMRWNPGMEFYAPSHNKWLTTDQAMGHSHAHLSTPKVQSGISHQLILDYAA